ncbi:MAG: HAD-IG family 5'-nucleotidase [bacterium]
MNIKVPGLEDPSQVESLLESLRREASSQMDRSRQIYCNRDLNLEKVDCVGFDMDYTLAPYHQDALDALSVKLTLERLVKERGYSPDILGIEPVPDFAIRGLVIDTWKGNVLKMDAHRHVGAGYHGFRELTAEERKEYRDATIRLNDSSRFWLVDTLFALPEAFLYAAIIDHLHRTEPDRQHDFKRLYGDIRYCIDLAHRDGSIKTEIMGNTEKYIRGKDEDLALTLHKFRSSGKRLFLLTNSFPVFSSHVMRHLLDGVLPEYPSWKNYFDIIIAGASKPTFFTERAPFLIADEDGKILGEEYQSLDKDVIYQGGNLVDFERMSGIGGERVVYVGDHIYGDIVRSKKSSAWRTVMIVQEMQGELSKSDALREELSRLDAVDSEVFRLTERLTFDQKLVYRIDALIEEGNGFDVDALKIARKELVKTRDQLRRRRKELLVELDDAENALERQFNPYWGLIFRLANENTLFGEQVEDYACLYTSHVSNFLNYSPLHYFRAPRQLMPHERY